MWDILSLQLVEEAHKWWFVTLGEFDPLGRSFRYEKQFLSVSCENNNKVLHPSEHPAPWIRIRLILGFVGGCSNSYPFCSNNTPTVKGKWVILILKVVNWNLIPMLLWVEMMLAGKTSWWTINWVSKQRNIPLRTGCRIGAYDEKFIPVVESHGFELVCSVPRCLPKSWEMKKGMRESEL